MVVIVDPHLKRTDDYPVYKKAQELGVLVKQKNGQDDYEGWCWPGSSSWVDFFNPASWDFWKSLFKTSKVSSWSWTESTEDIHIWNDMNEVCDALVAIASVVIPTTLATSSRQFSTGLKLPCPRI
jgi:alpha 1,3-glucosidase